MHTCIHTYTHTHTHTHTQDATHASMDPWGRTYMRTRRAWVALRQMCLVTQASRSLNSQPFHAKSIASANQGKGLMRWKTRLLSRSWETWFGTVLFARRLNALKTQVVGRWLNRCWICCTGVRRESVAKLGVHVCLRAFLCVQVHVGLHGTRVSVYALVFGNVGLRELIRQSQVHGDGV
jgi:hypothetical protein